MKDYAKDLRYIAVQTGADLIALARRLGQQRPEQDPIAKYTWKKARQ